ncbi:MAG: acetate--CoA ligase family protein [Candidatus Bipolaricaulota bacterium]|nr:acetate--CoA ligase family protein [Candidatus Bipolaricaulota bacterium]
MGEKAPHGLEIFFHPRGVAVVGSTGEGKMGRVLVDQLVAGGYSPVYAVNPRGEGAPGVRAAAHSFAELAGAGHVVDLAVIASPADTVAAMLEDAGRAGVHAAAVIASGFAECGEKAKEGALVSVARAYGIRFIGPNCAGLVNTKWSLFPTLETRPPMGDVALVSQSGALGGAVLSWAEEQGVGFSKFVSYGNGADLTDVDFLDYLRGDAETKVVALYLETVSDGRAFIEAARRLTAVKPLVVIKSGRSAAGGRATLSHTGSLAGTDAVYDAAFRQSGAMRVDGIEEMFDVCRGLASFPPVRGKRVVIVTNSGGPGVLSTDAAEVVGLDLAAPSPALRRRLAERLPSYCSLGNPIDLTVQGGEAEYRDVLSMALEEYDAAVAIDVNTPYLDAALVARGIVTAAKVTGKPVAATFMAGKTAAAALPVLIAGSVPDFPTGERAVAVLALLANDQARRLARRQPPPPEPAESSLPGRGLILSEPEAMNWLEAQGLPVPQRRLARSAEEAATAAAALGFPVAIKVVASGVVHKTEIGGVVLDVASKVSARSAFRELSERAKDLGFCGVLVVPMVQDAVEMLVGVSRDPQFGPVVAVGLGGVTAEALHDVALRVAPIDEAEARVMLGELRASSLLGAFRGRPARDLGALASLVARVSQLPFRYPDLAELDLNPVFALEARVVIGDVRAARVGSDAARGRTPSVRLDANQGTIA